MSSVPGEMLLNVRKGVKDSAMTKGIDTAAAGSSFAYGADGHIDGSMYEHKKVRSSRSQHAALRQAESAPGCRLA